MPPCGRRHATDTCDAPPRRLPPGSCLGASRRGRAGGRSACATVPAPCTVMTESPMVATDKLFAGSIPEIYDRLLVPLIFKPYALDLAGRLAEARPRDVLETAAGTGVLTRALAARLPAEARIVASDLNQ